jgi:hypothetical protein
MPPAKDAPLHTKGARLVANAAALVLVLGPLHMMLPMARAAWAELVAPA